MKAAALVPLVLVAVGQSVSAVPALDSFPFHSPMVRRASKHFRPIPRGYDGSAAADAVIKVEYGLGGHSNKDDDKDEGKQAEVTKDGDGSPEKVVEVYDDKTYRYDWSYLPGLVGTQKNEGEEGCDRETTTYEEKSHEQEKDVKKQEYSASGHRSMHSYGRRDKDRNEHHGGSDDDRKDDGDEKYRNAEEDDERQKEDDGSGYDAL
ncbi:hypothetical protein ACQY0O_002070 [Thecaphora frezii]